MSAIQTLGTFLAIAAGFLVGLSTVLQKKGLLQTKDIGEKTGNKREYLKNVYWWFGMLSCID